MSVRLAAVAGSFYPFEKKELEKQLGGFLKEKPKKTAGKIMAVIVPHAGYQFSGAVAAKAFSLFKGLGRKTEQEVLLVGPSHVASFIGASVCLAEKWQTPLGFVKRSARAKEFVCGLVSNIEEVHFDEHCIEVELPFLQKTIGRFSIVPIVCGEIAPEVLALELDRQIGAGTLIVASSDLSHYLPYEDAVLVDRKTIEAILTLDIQKMEEIGAACGKIPVLALMHLAKKRKWKPVLLDYKNSGDTAGDKKRVVGYAAIAFEVE